MTHRKTKRQPADTTVPSIPGSFEDAARAPAGHAATSEEPGTGVSGMQSLGFVDAPITMAYGP